MENRSERMEFRNAKQVREPVRAGEGFGCFKLSCLLAGGLWLAPASGCGAEACGGDFPSASIEVTMAPSIATTYDVRVVMDGAAGAFTCLASETGWSVTNASGVLANAYVTDTCGERGFTLIIRPRTVEVMVEAVDGSWNGSASETPEYAQQVVCGATFDGEARVTVVRNGG